MHVSYVWLSIPFKHFSALQNCYFMSKFYQQLAISPIASRANQAFFAITGVTGYKLNQSPELEEAKGHDRPRWLRRYFQLMLCPSKCY